MVAPGRTTMNRCIDRSRTAAGNKLKNTIYMKNRMTNWPTPEGHGIQRRNIKKNWRPYTKVGKRFDLCKFWRDLFC